MASANNISVAVERAVHDSLADLARSIMLQHGIRIDSVRFDWIDIVEVSPDPFQAVLRGVSVESKTGVR